MWSHAQQAASPSIRWRRTKELFFRLAERRPETVTPTLIAGKISRPRHQKSNGDAIETSHPHSIFTPPPPAFPVFTHCTIAPPANTPGTWVCLITVPSESYCKNGLMMHYIFRYFSIYRSCSHFILPVTWRWCLVTVMHFVQNLC